MVTLNYFIDSVQNANCVNDAADFFLTPLRELLDGRTYEVVYKSNGSIDSVQEVAERVDFFAQNKIFAVLLVLSVVPVVLGFALKIVAALGDAAVEYDRVQRWINAQPRPPQEDGPPHEDGPQGKHLQGRSSGQCYQLGNKMYCLDVSGIRSIPAEVVEPGHLDPANAAKLYPLTQLAAKWHSLDWNYKCRTTRHGDHDTVAANLVRIPAQVENRAGYCAAKNDLSDAENQRLIERTHDEMVDNLTGILELFQRGASSAEEYDTLVGLAAAAETGTSTLHEKAHEYHRKLLQARALEDKILAIVQQLKENIFLDLLQKAGYREDAMNGIRHKYGTALGLRKGSEDVDKMDVADIPIETFLKEFTVEAVVAYVQTELNKFNFVDQICALFGDELQNGEECRIRHLVPEELASDGDLGAFVLLKAFFSPVPEAQVDKWMSLPANAQQKRQYDEACAELEGARKRLAEAEAELQRPGSDQHAAQQAIEAARSNISLYEDNLAQYEIPLRKEINEQGVIGLLLCMRVIQEGDLEVKPRMVRARREAL